MATITDDFNRADSTNLGAGWVEVSGDWSIVSNQLSPGAAGGTIILRAAAAMDTSDHSVQFTIAATAAASQGVWCRGNATFTNGYLLRNDGTQWDLFSVVGSSFVSIGTYAVAAAPGDIAKVQAVGSTIKAVINGIQRISVIDTFVTTGTGVGFRSASAGALKYDDFTAADITAGTALGSASSTDAAQALTGAKASTLGIAAEVAAGQALLSSKTAALTAAVQTEAAQPLASGTSRTLTLAAATETAIPLTGSKTASLGPATETSSARPLTAGGATLDGTYIIGAPYSPWSVGQPHGSGWTIGPPH